MPDLFPEIFEQRLEAMIEQGRKIVLDAIEEYKPIAIFGAFSGGDDSIVPTHFGNHYFGAAAMHARTMTAVRQNYEHVIRCSEKFGWQLVVKEALAEGMPEKHRDGAPWDQTLLPSGRWTDGNTAYEEFVLNFGFPGPGQHARMYQRLKERSFNAIKREAKIGANRNATVMFLSGIRHDESAIRAGYKRAVQKVGATVWVNPFYWCSAVDFHLYREEFGLPRNPVKPIIGISGDCNCGTMCTDPTAERVGIAQLDPERDKEITKLEERCASLGLPCKWAHRPEKKREQSDLQQLLLWGDEPEQLPACVGCVRRLATPEPTQ